MMRKRLVLLLLRIRQTTMRGGLADTKKDRTRSGRAQEKKTKKHSQLTRQPK